MSPCLAVFLSFSSFLVLHSCALGELPTDPREVEALKVFGETLGVTPSWDFTVDPCSGSNGWDNTQGEGITSSGVECDCTISNTSCHVAKLVVVSNLANGTISRAIGKLKYLKELNLQGNLISGPIPDELGSLTNLETVTVAVNRLSGSIPRSIGNLKRLVSLSLSVNNFTGTIPPEFGNLTSLRELRMDSSGIGGELPGELANLQSLRVLNVFDNNLIGQLPHFLGKLSSLERLRLFGNKFTGPIPPSLGDLSELRVLQLGDVRNGGVIPSTLNSLKELRDLSMRGCQLTGTIPELDLSELVTLDLSFNNLTGSIPESFTTTLPRLQRLFLGTNNLAGSLPPLHSLAALDLSFNGFSGPLPKVNGNASFVGNSFSDDRPTLDVEDCLVESLDCENVNGGKNTGFAINCGGPEMEFNGTTFSEDTADTSNGVGTYYSNQSWGLTSAGYAQSFRVNPEYFETIVDTTRSRLYQTARTAPTSIRYLGVGMRAGAYTVRLYFAEIVIGVSSDRPGLGRRFFDVYIQGKRRLKRFNIVDAAGASAKVVERTFSGINVTDGVIDIHFLWRGKGTCCSPLRTYGPLVSAIEVLPEEFDTGGSNDGNSFIGVIVGVPVSLAVVAILGLSGFVLWRSRRRRKESPPASENEELKLLGGKLKIYTYTELRTATQDFSADNLVGKGASGSVFQGVLMDGTLIAVKQLVKTNQSTKEFVNEANLISSVQHRNLVKVLGCCVEGDSRIMVFEFLENNNLYQSLLSKDRKLNLDWPTRYNICVGVAKGLAYLHEESAPRIIHRDIKATNVLLDKSLVPKIGDFGLARLFEDQQSHISNTRVAGTTGYLAPEYALRGILTEKADVYSYGILLLEIVSARPNMYITSDTGDHLSDYAWQLYEANRAMELLDKTAEKVDEEQVLRVIQVGLLCTQATAAPRPIMSRVVAMLTGSEAVNMNSLVPGYFARTYPSNSTSGATSSSGADCLSTGSFDPR